MNYFVLTQPHCQHTLASERLQIDRDDGFEETNVKSRSIQVFLSLFFASLVVIEFLAEQAGIFGRGCFGRVN